MFRLFRILIRLSLLSAHLVTGLLLATLLLTKPLKKTGFYNPSTLIRHWLLVTRYFIGCRIINRPPAIQKPTLLISNHVSWLDILVIGGLYDIHFLSKEDIKNWPIIGFLTVISGTLLIQRGSGSEGANLEIQHTLSQGDSVGLFPEGTTSSGYQTKAFHSRLLKSAYQAQTSISVVSLSYSINGKTRDKGMGWEKQTLLEHLFYVLGQKKCFVHINLVKQLTDYEHMPRKQLAQHCRALIDADLERNHYPCE